MKRPTIRLLALLRILRVGHATIPALLQAQTIWVEGEKPARSTMSRHPWRYDQIKKNLLYGSDWISNWSDDKDGVAEYVIMATRGRNSRRPSRARRSGCICPRMPCTWCSRRSEVKDAGG
ncbi:MAG: hypothetical protein ACLP53_24270 [Isosphaeraceae bacterium]